MIKTSGQAEKSRLFACLKKLNARNDDILAGFMTLNNLNSLEDLEEMLKDVNTLEAHEIYGEYCANLCGFQIKKYD